MNTRKNRSNQTIESMRFVSCVSILFIHCGFPVPKTVSGYSMAVARFAVPFLILLSGWYADHNGETTKAKKKTRDTMRVIAIGGAVCIIWNCLNSYLRYGELTSWIIPYCNQRTAVNFLLYNRAVFFNSVFYYFFILIYVYALFIAAQKLRITRILYYLIPLLLLTGIYICEFSDLPWYYGGNYLFVGLPMFMLGHFLRTKQDKLLRLKDKEWIIILTGVLITSCEYRIQGSRYLYSGSIVIAVAVLLFCINHGTMRCPQTLAAAGSFLSLPVIVVHCEVRDTLQILFSFGRYMLPIMVLLISLAIAILYEKIRRCF